MIKKCSLAVLSVIGLTLGCMSPTAATEPRLEMFTPDMLIKMISGKPDFFNCKSSWDPSSSKTEVFSKCSNPYAEAYIHGNAEPFGDDGNFWQGGVSYASFTVKKSASYPRLEAMSQLCEGMIAGTNTKVQLEAKGWFTKNYKKVSNKKVLTKAFNGHTMSIVGGPGPIRTVTCGVKPSK